MKVVQTAETSEQVEEHVQVTRLMEILDHANQTAAMTRRALYDLIEETSNGGRSYPGAKLAKFAADRNITGEWFDGLKEHLQVISDRLATGKPFTLKTIKSRMRGITGQNPDEYLECLFSSLHYLNDDGPFYDLGNHYYDLILDARYGKLDDEDED